MPAPPPIYNAVFPWLPCPPCRSNDPCRPCNSITNVLGSGMGPLGTLGNLLGRNLGGGGSALSGGLGIAKGLGRVAGGLAGGPLGGGLGGGLLRGAQRVAGGLLGNGFSLFPVRYANGEIQLSVTDIRSSGFGVPWEQTRRFANQMTADYDGPNGYNWFVDGLSYLLEFDDDTIAVMGDANNVLWFDLVDGQYVARFDVKQRLVHDPVDEVFRLLDTDGSTIEFHDFGQTNYSQGLFKRKIDAGGNSLTVVSYNDGEIEEVQRETTVDGVTTTESFLYEYDWYGRLSRVVLRRLQLAFRSRDSVT